MFTIIILISLSENAKSLTVQYINKKLEELIMKINKRSEGSMLTIYIEGRLDTSTSPELSKELDSSLEGVTQLVFDFTLLEYISSSGLRVLLAAQKAMNGKGTMIVKNVSELVMEVFEITGFTDILTIE